jgi:hypothetical protein
MQERLANLWQPGQGVDISPMAMEDNKFMFQFFHPWDMERIYQRGPWLLDNYMLILRKLAFGEDPLTVPLDTTEIWIQIHHLPFGFMTREIGLLIGSHIGKFINYDDLNNYGSWRKFMRIRVAINVNEPLKTDWAFVREQGEVVKVSFKYEKLGNFCYVCGLLGHTENFCSKKFEEGMYEGGRRWGNFLRAEVGGNAGGATTNKWLRGGRNTVRGGRSGGQNGGLNANNDNNGSNNTGLNAGNGFWQHAIYGRVKVERDLVTKSFLFFKWAAGWVPIDLTGRSSEERINPGNKEQTGSSNQPQLMVTNTRLNALQLNALSTNIHGGYIQNTNSTTASKLLLNGPESVPKKRSRVDNGFEDNAEDIIDATMQVDAVAEASGAGGTNITMQQNPLFDVNVVMAGPENQACQQK